MSLERRLALLEERANLGANVFGTAVINSAGQVVAFAGWHEGAGHVAVAEWIRRPPNASRDFVFFAILAEDDPALAKHPPLIPARLAHPATLALFAGRAVNDTLRLGWGGDHP